MADIISEKHKKLLLSYQINNTENIIRCVRNNGAVLDASGTGSGKTYSSACAVATMKLRPIIVSPKSVLSVWKNVCKIFDAKPFFIVNYETLKSGKYYNENRDRVKCPHLTFDKKEKKYKWSKLPKDIVFIFDEVHKCSNIKTHNGQLLISAKDSSPNGIIIISATIADRIELFRPFFYVLNFIEKSKADELELDFKQYMRIIDKWVARSQKPLVSCHNMIFPNRGTKMSLDVLENFPETSIAAVPYYGGKTMEQKIQFEYEEINKQLELLRGKTAKDRGNILVKVMRSHQRVELLKIPTFVELTNEFLNDDHSVVIFVNYTQTLKTLAKMLQTNCLIYGEQTGEEREYNIQEFQANRQHIIICNLASGSVGVSLHDVHHKRKRASIISPCWNATNLVQALGRVWRANGSKSIQRIVYVANTIEESISEKLQVKLKNLENINNGDLDLSNITFVKKPEKMVT